MKKLFSVATIFLICTSLFSLEVILDENGYPLQRIENTADGTVTSNFTYIDGKLGFTTKFLEDNEEPYEIEYYLRSPVDNSLVGVKRFTGTSLVGGDYLYSEETLFLNATDNLVFTTDFEVQNDGTITLTQEDGSINTYSSNGLLLKKEVENTVTEYGYDDKKDLVFSTQTDNGIVTLTKYKEEKKFEETIIKNGITANSTVYYTSGKVSTIYENGKPVAVVTYYQDNKRVRGVEYL